MSALYDCGGKTRRRVVDRMLPRRGPSKVAPPINIPINQTLADLCTAEGEFFVYPYATFFSKDGIHLTLKSKAMLCNLVGDAIHRSRRSARLRVETPQRQYTRMIPENSFADVLKKGTVIDNTADKSKTETGEVMESSAILFRF